MIPQILYEMKEYRNYFNEIKETIEFTRQKIIDDKYHLRNSTDEYFKRCRTDTRLVTLMENLQQRTDGLLTILNETIDKLILISQI